MSDDHQKDDTPSFPALAGVAALACLLIAFQYITLSKFSVLQPGVRHDSLGTLIGQDVAKVDLTRYDLFLVLLILVLFLTLALSHILRGSLTGIARWCLASDRRAVLALSLLTALSVRFYIASGEISCGAGLRTSPRIFLDRL
jgi:hypothetical protein